MNIGLVLEGGGGKGAYQIGVWEAIRALGIENDITVIAGTSVGALNGALFWKGDLALAKSLWREISTPKLMSVPVPGDETEAFFSNRGLSLFVRRALKQPMNKKRLFYAACKQVNSGKIKYFPVHSMIDPAYQKKFFSVRQQFLQYSHL